MPLTVSRIHIPALGYTVVDTSTQQQRQASLAIFYDIYKDDQYACKLNRRSAITALCMYDKDDVAGMLLLRLFPPAYKASRSLYHAL